MDRITTKLFSACFGLSVAALGCSGGDGEVDGDGRKPRFAATIHPIAAILREVVGERGEVARLIPLGASPHTYDARPSDAVQLDRASALFLVSDKLDAWAARMPVEARVEMIDLVPESFRLRTVAQENGRGDGEQSEGETDPHFWTDPLAVHAILPGLVESLAAIDPDGSDVYRRNAERFGDELKAVHGEIEEMLGSLERRTVVLHHPSFRYFARRYGLEVTGVVEPFAGKEPTPRDLKRLIDAMKATGTKAIFTEPQLSKRAVEAIAEVSGAVIYELDPIGGVEGRETYREMIMHNARVVREALR